MKQKIYESEAFMNDFATLRDSFGKRPVCVKVFYKGKEVMSNATERDIRALQVMVHDKKVNIQDLQVVEYYKDENGNTQKNVLEFQPDGAFSNDFKSNFYNELEDMAFHILEEGYVDYRGHYQGYGETGGWSTAEYNNLSRLSDTIANTIYPLRDKAKSVYEKKAVKESLSAMMAINQVLHLMDEIKTSGAIKLNEKQLRNIIKESIMKVLKERSLDDIEHTDLYGYNDTEDYSEEELVKVAKSGDYTTAFIDYLKELIGPSAENLTLNSFIKDMRSGKIRYCEKNDGIYYINDWSGV
jgi:hypothetical protein